MTILQDNREFLDGLVDYYTSEAGSYRQFAEQFVSELDSVSDAAFGIVVGCVYSSFLDICKNQGVQLGLEDIQEFNTMIRGRAAEIKKALVDSADAAAPRGANNGPAGDKPDVE